MLAAGPSGSPNCLDTAKPQASELVMKEPYTKCGKCGDMVWQRNRYGPISYPYHIPANPRTAAQRQVRGAFGSVSARWRMLSEEQRLVWCVAGKSEQSRRRLGQRWPLKGFNYFVRVNVALVNRGQAQVDLPPAESLQPTLALPLISHRLFLEARGLLTVPAPALPASPGLPPSLSG
jgi:hypothetical protein